jgi:hypothetical protein
MHAPAGCVFTQWIRCALAIDSATRAQNVDLKNLSFLAKSKIGIFACFFAQT